MSEPESGSPLYPNPGARTCRAGGCPLRSRWGLLPWALALGAVVYLQWPMLKGLYYKAAEQEAPVSPVAWRTGGLTAALEESARTGKPVLVDFTASWCPPCKVMKHEVWPDTRVARVANERYVPVLVDVDDGQSAGVTRGYGIRSIPTVLVLDAHGKVVRTGSYMSKDDMLDFLVPKS